MTRACLDANVLISHLLNPTGHKPPNRIVNAGIAREFDLVLFETTFDELVKSVGSKPYLAARIDPQDVGRLASALRLSATVLPEPIEQSPRLTRDPNDDYLIANALIEELDYLVTGDQDLLVFRKFENVRIVSPAEFVDILGL